MKNHANRLIAICVLWALSLVSVVVLVATDHAEGTSFGVVTGALATLTTALIDSLSVEKRRRTPGSKAVADDVP